MNNSERFSGRVHAYERYRTRFPNELLEGLQSFCGLAIHHDIADVGTGTGMLAELFLQHGNNVIAIEPNQEMRAACLRLAQTDHHLTVIDGTAEETRLPDHSVDFVVVGRAFHWFDRQLAMREFARILRPAGWLVIVSSEWSGDGSPMAKAFEDILHRYGMDYQRVVDAQLRSDEIRTLFQDEHILVRNLHNYEELSWEQMLGRMQSLSVTPLPAQPSYTAFHAALLAYFDRYQSSGTVRVPVSYKLVCGKIAEPWQSTPSAASPLSR